MKCFIILVALVVILPVTFPAQKITKEIIKTGNKERAYYLFIPENAKASAPLLITLHGSGRNGISLVEKWKDLASKEGFIVAGPDATSIESWRTPDDGPAFLHDLIEALKSKYPVNPKRVYLFGHSAGAVFALGMSMMESNYFAATAVHAGAWRSPQEFAVIDAAKRKIPIAIAAGDRDQFFPMSALNATSDRLKEKGFDVEMSIIKNHDHNYYDTASKINDGLWAFLKKYELKDAPVYEEYKFR